MKRNIVGILSGVVWCALAVSLCVAMALAVLFLVFLGIEIFKSGDILKFAMKCLPMAERMVWPVFFILTFLLFRDKWTELLDELPGFIGRSRYTGPGGVECTVADVCRQSKDIMSFKMSDNVRDVMSRMVANDYTEVPLLSEDGRVLGSFSGEVLMKRLTEKDSPIGEDVTFERLFGSNGTLLKSRRLKFVSASTPLSAIDRIYRDAHAKGDDFGLVFVTETGAADSPIVGIVSVWDIRPGRGRNRSTGTTTKTEA